MLGGGALSLFRKHSFLAQEQSQSTLATDIEPSERQAMAGVAEDFMRQLNAPGLSLAVARDGRIVYEQSLGVTGHGSKERLTTSHLFRIASVSKPITSAAILRLMEQGRVQIEETVFGRRGILATRYSGSTYEPGIEQITIDHLLTHTSGGWSNLENDPMFLNVGMDQAELISWTLKNQALAILREKCSPIPTSVIASWVG